MKELQRSLKEERKRADSLEKKSEEKAGWHVVGQDMETRSSHVRVIIIKNTDAF